MILNWSQRAKTMTISYEHYQKRDAQVARAHANRAAKVARSEKEITRLELIATDAQKGGAEDNVYHTLRDLYGKTRGWKIYKTKGRPEPLEIYADSLEALIDLN